MRVFFLSEIPCSLSVGGIYLGLVDLFERSVELDPSDDLFCSIKPQGDYLPVNFIFNEKFLIDPPEQVKLYHASGFAAVYFCNFLHADQTLRVVKQERLGGALLTLAFQGKLQLYFEYGGRAEIIPLPDMLFDASFEETREGFLLRGGRAFALVSFDGELILCEEGKVLDTMEHLQAEIPFHDCMGHTAVCQWQGGKLTSCSIRSQNPPRECTFALALFESVLIGADAEPFLSKELLPKAGALREYLGDYCAVALTGESDKVGLVYKRKPRVFDVRYFRVELCDQKICNISPIN